MHFLNIFELGNLLRLRFRTKVPKFTNFYFLVFVLYYTIHGIFWERSFELLASMIATVIVMLYCIVHFSVKGRKFSHTSESYKLQLVSVTTNFVTIFWDIYITWNWLDIWVKVFKNGTSKICGRQPLKNMKWYGVLRQTVSLQVF